MKRIIYSLILLLLSTAANAEVVTFDDNFAITIPDIFISEPDTNYIYSGYTEAGALLLVKQIAKSDFDAQKVLNHGDELAFNLRNYNLTASDSEGFLDIRHDHSLKTYRSFNNGQYLYTYTSYMYTYPYTILYIPSSAQDDKSVLMSIINTIQDRGDSWWQRLFLHCERGMGVFVLIFISFAVLLSATKSNIIFILSLIAILWASWPAWGDWAVFIPFFGIFVIFMLLAKNSNFGDLLTSMADGIG